MTDALHSPCVDAGDPASDYSLEPADNGGRVNMGRYGNTAEASKGVAGGLGPILMVETATRYPTIQAAIDAAVPDGKQTVEVPPGTYRERIDFKGKAVTVRSTDPSSQAVRDSTIVDGMGLGSVVTFMTGETRDAVLSGLTITNGRSTQGAGIYCSGGASPTITYNTIRQNWLSGASSLAGGGIFCAGGTAPLIENNTVLQNGSDAHVAAAAVKSAQAPAVYGGGILCQGESSPTVRGNRVEGNTATYGGGIGCYTYVSATITGNFLVSNKATYGGGLHLESCSSLVADNEISTNEAWYGGGVYSGWASTCTIRRNTISGNIATAGAGVSCSYDSSSLLSNRITGNTVRDDGVSDYPGGAGVHCQESAATVKWNIISDNTSPRFGGGVFCQWQGASPPTFVNNTLQGNTAQEVNGGSGLYALNCQPIVRNCIISGCGPVPAMSTSLGSFTNVAYSCLYANGGGNALPSGATNIIAVDPLMVNPGSGDYRLRSAVGRWDGTTWVLDTQHSPCIDAGDPTSDFSEEPRPNGGRVNLGADGNTAQASKSQDPLAITVAPAGVPNPCASGAQVQCSVTAQDGLGHTLSYQWTARDGSSASAGSFDDATAPSPIWTAPENRGTGLADYTLTVVVSCSDLGSQAGSFTQQVSPAVDEVQITAGPAGDPNPVSSGGTVLCAVTAQDPLGHALTYAWSAKDGDGADAGSFDDATKPSPTWTAPANPSGATATYTISVTVTCSEGKVQSAGFTQQVSSRDHALRLISGPSATPSSVAPNGSTQCAVSADDSLGHALSYEWSAEDDTGAPAGSFDDSTRADALWNAPENTSGHTQHYTLRVRVRCTADDHGVTGSCAVEVRSVQDAVQITAGPVSSVNPCPPGWQVRLGLAASDSLGHPLTYQWQATDAGGNAVGSFDDATSAVPIWTSPADADVPAGGLQVTVRATARCSSGVTSEGVCYQRVVEATKRVFSMPRDVVAGVNQQTLLVPLWISDGMGIQKVTIRVYYDPAAFTRASVDAGGFPGTLLHGRGWAVETATGTDAHGSYLLISSVGIASPLPTGAGALLNAMFTVADDRSLVGTESTLELMAPELVTDTGLPLPVDTTDGRVTITSGKGDVNVDSQITVRDVVLALRQIAGKDLGTWPADFNDDRRWDIFDAVLIMVKALEVSSSSAPAQATAGTRGAPSTLPPTIILPQHPGQLSGDFETEVRIERPGALNGLSFDLLYNQAGQVVDVLGVTISEALDTAGWKLESDYQADPGRIHVYLVGPEPLSIQRAPLLTVRFRTRPGLPADANTTLSLDSTNGVVVKASGEPEMLTVAGLSGHLGPGAVSVAAPSDVRVQAAALAGLVSWTDNSAGQAQFRVLRRELGAGGWSGWGQVAELPAGTTSFTDETVEAGKSYEYSVLAVLTAPEAAESAAVGGTSAASVYALGDFDGDGKLTAQDVAAFTQGYLSARAHPTDPINARADMGRVTQAGGHWLVTRDGKVDDQDLAGFMALWRDARSGH